MDLFEYQGKQYFARFGIAVSPGDVADNVDEVRTHAGNILGLDIKGHVVRRLWIERSSDIAKEYYASFTLDRPNKTHLGMLSAQGGVEIAVVDAENPDAIAFLSIDPVRGLD